MCGIAKEVMSTEIVITIGIVLFLLFIAGATLDFFTAAVILTIAAVLALIAVFFVIFTIVLIRSKACTAYFSRFGTRQKSKFESAVYSIDGTEYFNAFPKEVILAKQLYKKDKPVKVRLAAGKRFVLDANAVATIIAGDFAVIAMAVFIAPVLADLFFSL